MRNSAILFATLTMLSACTSDPSATPTPTPDLQSDADLSMPPPSPDLSPPPGLTQCGNIPVLGPQGASTTAACQSCITSSCCTEGMTCGSNLACSSYRQCVSTCTTGSCIATCGTTYPTGKTVSDAFDSCRNSKCNPSCNDVSCVGNVVWKDPQQSTYPVRVFAVDFATRKVIPNVTIKVCPPGDAACASPTGMGVTDATGQVTLNLPVIKSGLNGFLELTEPTLQPTLNFHSHTDNASYFANGVIQVFLVTKTTFAQLAFAAGATPDPTRGHLGFLTEDCSKQLIAGVNVTLSTADAKSVTAYAVAGVPSKNATQTDTSGFGLIANAPVGAGTATAKIGTTRMGSEDLLFRAGYLTSTNLAPTP